MSLTLPKVLGLWAPAPESGKSTVARFIRALYPWYERHPFAFTLKEMIILLLVNAGYSREEAERYVYDDKSTPLERLPGKPTSRHLQRTLGTEWGRNLVHEDLWETIWSAITTAALDREAAVIAEDVRMINEAHAVRAKGGEVWAIRRKGFVDTSGHGSEAGLGDFQFDRELTNDGSLEEFLQQLADLQLTSHRSIQAEFQSMNSRHTFSSNQ